MLVKHSHLTLNYTIADLMLLGFKCRSEAKVAMRNDEFVELTQPIITVLVSQLNVHGVGLTLFRNPPRTNFGYQSASCVRAPS